MGQAGIVPPIRELRDELLRKIPEWVTYVRRSSERETVWDGIMHKSATRIEWILESCAEALLTLTGKTGRIAARSITNDKPVECLTLGLVVRLLKRLSPVYGGRFPAEGQLIGPATSDLLDRIVTLRNTFAHDYIDGVEARNRLLELLDAACELCRCRLVETGIAFQEGADIR